MPLTSIDKELVKQVDVFLGDQSHQTDSSMMQKDSEMIPNQQSDDDTTANATSPSAGALGVTEGANMNLDVDNHKV